MWENIHWPDPIGKQRTASSIVRVGITSGKWVRLRDKTSPRRVGYLKKEPTLQIFSLCMRSLPLFMMCVHTPIHAEISLGGQPLCRSGRKHNRCTVLLGWLVLWSRGSEAYPHCNQALVFIKVHVWDVLQHIGHLLKTYNDIVIWSRVASHTTDKNRRMDRC